MRVRSNEIWKFTHQRALQGIRGIAVLAVFAFHVGELDGGWLGVEIFFVLSGFLITMLLLDEAYTTDTVSIVDFYIRRFARLLPAVLVMLSVVIAFCWAVDLSYQPMRRGALASLLYFANWAEVAGLPMHGLGHMWSLSIEEQFYILWPLALSFVFTHFGSRGVAIFAGIGFLVSVVIRTVLSTIEGCGLHVYFGSETRAAGLLIGCVAGALLSVSRGALSRSVPAAMTYLCLFRHLLGIFHCAG